MNTPLYNGDVKSSEVSISKTTRIYSKEEITNISKLGDIFKGIRVRLKSDGIDIEIERKKLLEQRQKSYNITTDEESTNKTS